MNVNLETDKIKNLLINFLVPLVSVTLCTILFFVVIYPDIKKTPQMESELATQTTLRNQLQEKSTKLHRFVDFKSVLEENSALVNKVMPAEQNVPGLLDQLNQIAGESGLNLTKLSYSVADVSIQDDTQNPNSYSSVLVSLGAEGSYAQMIAFMEAVENASRVVNISNYRFSKSNDENADYGFTFILSAPYMDVQSSAVTDEALSLDLTSNDFVDFINKIKGMRYFERSGDISKIKVDVTKEDDVTKESSASKKSSSDNL